jgi:hypothetical protein
MRAEPFVQAELRKGDVVAEALDQVQSYSLMRHKAAVEVQMSESLLAAEEEMMNLANRLKESTDIYNVFKPDGTGTWSDNVNDVRERLADSIQSRSARDEFRARFNQSELSKRFQLRGAIDSRIQARANAAAAARMQAAEDALSDPYNPTGIVDYEMAVMGIRVEEDAAIRSGTATAETTGVMNAKLAENIATRTTQAYVFDDPMRAVALAEALDLQDEVDAGTITVEEAYARSLLPDDAAYTLHTLDALPREQALEIIYNTLGRANRLYEAAERRRTEQEDRNNAALDRNYRGMFMFADRTKEFDFGDLMMAAPSVAAEYSARLTKDGVSVTTDTPITADDARTAFIDYFDMRNYLTPEQRSTIDSAFNRPAASSFATRNNEDVAADLALRAESGQLTVAGLTSARSSITFEYHNQMLNKISLEADEALNAAKRVARFQFSFEEGMATDTGGARASRSAYFSVAGQLETEAMRRRAEGNPMTSTEMDSFLNVLLQSQREIYTAGLISDRNAYVEGLRGVFAGLGTENPLANLDALYFSFTAAEQSDYASRYRNIRLELLDYQSRIDR